MLVLTFCCLYRGCLAHREKRFSPILGERQRKVIGIPEPRKVNILRNTLLFWENRMLFFCTRSLGSSLCHLARRPRPLIRDCCDRRRGRGTIGFLLQRERRVQRFRRWPFRVAWRWLQSRHSSWPPAPFLFLRLSGGPLFRRPTHRLS